MQGEQSDPVRLIEDPVSGDRFLVYATEKGPRLDIRYQGETLWMTQAQIAELFGREVSTVSRHIANVLDEGELDEATSLQKTQTTTGRPAILYSLDMVISVGYRVSSAQATIFRRWATGILVQFAKKGFVVDSGRLKQPENVDRVAELCEIIRSDEANVYRELRQICAMCQDYDGSAETAREFYQRMQAKLVYAVTSHTPAEIIAGKSGSYAAQYGLADMDGRQCAENRCHCLEELSGRIRNQRAQSADDHPSRYFRGPARPGQAGCDAGRAEPFGAPAAAAWPRGFADGRRRSGPRMRDGRPRKSTGSSTDRES